MDNLEQVYLYKNIFLFCILDTTHLLRPVFCKIKFENNNYSDPKLYLSDWVSNRILKYNNIGINEATLIESISFLRFLVNFTQLTLLILKY